MRGNQKINVNRVLILLGIVLGIEGLGDVILTPVRIKIANFEKSIQIYAMNNSGKFPVSLDVLLQFASTNYNYGNKPLLTADDLFDPWGEPFEYEYSGRKYRIQSSGPDRIMGTLDDIFEGSLASYLKPTQTSSVAVATSETVRPKGWDMKPEEIAELRESVLVTREKAERAKRAKANLIQWQLPLLIGIAAVVGVVMAWRHFGKRRKRIRHTDPGRDELSNAREAELGTNPNVKDTCGISHFLGDPSYSKYASYADEELFCRVKQGFASKGQESKDWSIWGAQSPMNETDD